MKSIADELPPEIARQIHPDWRKNEAAYWAARDQLVDRYRDQWVAFANGTVLASSKSPVEILRAAQQSGCHPFVTCVGREDAPCRMRRASFPYDTAYPGEALPLIEIEFRSSSGLSGLVLDRVIPDTGADSSALPWTDCQALGLNQNLGVPSRMSGVGGSSTATVTFLVWAFVDGCEYPCRLQVDSRSDEDILFRGSAGEVVINP